MKMKELKKELDDKLDRIFDLIFDTSYPDQLAIERDFEFEWDFEETDEIRLERNKYSIYGTYKKNTGDRTVTYYGKLKGKKPFELTLEFLETPDACYCTCYGVEFF